MALGAHVAPFAEASNSGGNVNRRTKKHPPTGSESTSLSTSAPTPTVARCHVVRCARIHVYVYNRTRSSGRASSVLGLGPGGPVKLFELFSRRTKISRLRFRCSSDDRSGGARTVTTRSLHRQPLCPTLTGSSLEVRGSRTLPRRARPSVVCAELRSPRLC